jgi:FAD/FMN-containing dehydrogenase
MTVVLPSGTVVDTEVPGAEGELAKKEASPARGLMDLRDELLADPNLVERIKRKYSYRNTNGYGIHSLLDGETPLGILRRIMIGSEGTLGFVAEVVYRAITLPPQTTVASLRQCTRLLRQSVRSLAGQGETGSNSRMVITGQCAHRTNQIGRRLRQMAEKPAS